MSHRANAIIAPSPSRERLRARDSPRHSRNEVPTPTHSLAGKGAGHSNRTRASGVVRRIGNARSGESARAQHASVAMAAGAATGVVAIARHRHREIDTETHAFTDDVGFRQLD